MTTRDEGVSAGRSPFGELLLSLRTHRGLTQEGLAKATTGGHIAPRSITSYERKARHAKDWVLPHRSGLRLLAQALDLDMVDRHAFAKAWNESRELRDTVGSPVATSTFIEAGREAKVKAVMDAWHKAQNGSPQMVFVGGVSGIGKSALVRHVIDTIGATTSEVMMTWGEASSWATNVEPYLAIRTATDRMLEAPDPSSSVPGPYSSRPKLTAENINRIVESVPLLGGALVSERVIRSLADDIDDDLISTINDQLAARSSTDTIGRFEEYSQVLTELSQSWPIVMVLEDLHWSGDPTTSLMMHLARNMKNRTQTPILIIGTYRNDELQSDKSGQPHPMERLLNTIGHEPYVHFVMLNDALSAKSGKAYIRGVIERKPMSDAANAKQFARWLYEQTSGHPLLTVELIRHLKEAGALTRQKDSSWTFLANKIPRQGPPAIATFIEQRLTRVEQPARRILDIAAVMNDVILTEIVADILQTEEEEILDVIDRELVDTHQLLVPGATVRLVHQSHETYRFPHAQFREHIYNKLPLARRRKLHLSIAEAMEQRNEDADTVALAEITSHYEKAEEWHSAQMTGYRLAQEAVIKLDWDLAEVWFPRAEALAIQARDPAQLWRTRAARLALLRGTGKYDEALELGTRILELGDIHYWPGTLALANHHIGEIYYDIGKIDTAVAHLETALELHHQENALDLAAAGSAMLSHATYRQGKYDLAHDYALAALQLSRELQNSWVQPEAVLAAANCEIDLGYYEDAIENYQLATELATMAGKLNNQYIPPMNIGLCYIYMGDYDTAIEHLTSLIATMESQTIYRLTAPARLYLGYALEARGDLEEAAESYAAASEIRRANIVLATLFDSVAGEMRVALRQNDNEAAMRWYKEITDYLNEHGSEGIEDPLLVKMSLAMAARHFGDEKAYRSYIERTHALMSKRAEMIANERSRTSYLTNVPVNRELQRLYAELKN